MPQYQVNDQSPACNMPRVLPLLLLTLSDIAQIVHQPQRVYFSLNPYFQNIAMHFTFKFNTQGGVQVIWMPALIFV